MQQINVGVIGTGWCGGIRANSCANSPLVNALHIAELKPERLEEVKAETNPSMVQSATKPSYKVLLNIDDIDAYIISATPETTHYPLAKECLATGRHVFMEKPLSLTLQEADELIKLAKKNKVKFIAPFVYTVNQINKRSTEFDLVSLQVTNHMPSDILGQGFVFGNQFLDPVFPQISQPGLVRLQNHLV